jgi:chemotaxis protein MotB
MRIEDDTQDQRLSLEITPLIDIIFILVLFFAVTTSFINPQEIDELKAQLLNLNNVKQKLLGEVRQYSAQVNDQSRLIQSLKDNYNNLNFDYSRMLDTSKEQTQKSGTRLQAAEARVEQLQQSLKTLEQSQSDLQQQLADQSARSHEAQLKSQKLASELRAQLEESGRLTHTMADLEFKNRQLQRVLDEKTQQNQKSGVSLASLAREHEHLQQQLTDEIARSREVQQQNQKLATELRDQQEESGRLTHAMADLELKNRQLQQVLDEKTQQNQKIDVSLASLTREHQILQQKLADETARGSQVEQQNQKLTTELRAQQEELGRLTDTLASLRQAQGNLQLRLADQTARSQQVQQQNEKLANELRDQTDKSGRLTNTIAGLLDENENLQQVIRGKTAQNQELDQLLVNARQKSQILSSELARLKLDKQDWEANEKILRTKVSQLEGQLVEFRELEKMKQERVDSLNQAQKNLDAGLKTQLKKNQLGIQRKQNRLILQLPDQILFDSGSADVKPGGRAVLREVGKILKTDLGKMLIQIGGHTDNVPLSSTSGSLFPSNWELSAARAVNVVHFFESTLGIDPERMSAVGYSEHQPVASNATPEGRARNRRIEIVVVQR